MPNRSLRNLEALESRLCLTVVVDLSPDGDLVVEGNADGPVEILALDEDTYQISDATLLLSFRRPLSISIKFFSPTTQTLYALVTC